MTLRSMTPLEQRFLATTQLKGCVFKECLIHETPITYEGLVTHLQTACKEVPFVCPKKCGGYFTMSNVDLHFHDKCSKAVMCRFCKFECSFEHWKTRHDCKGKMRYERDFYKN